MWQLTEPALPPDDDGSLPVPVDDSNSEVELPRPDLTALVCGGSWQSNWL